MTDESKVDFLDVSQIREDFPVLKRELKPGVPLFIWIRLLPAKNHPLSYW